MQRIFTYHSYKDYLKDIIKLHGRGAMSKLANAANCNRTYLSQCLSSKVHLIPDHIFGISEFLHLSEDESEYFLMMLLYDRSASRAIQIKIKRKMEKLVNADLVLSQKISKKGDSGQLSESQKIIYYSSWKYLLVHTLTSIKEFQTLSELVNKVRISEVEIIEILKTLTEMNLVIKHQNRYIHSGKNIHIDNGSILSKQNHMSWRLKSFDVPLSENNIQYTTLFTISREDWDSLRAQLLEFIEKQREFIHKSGSEEVFCFYCDLFQPMK